MASPNSTATTCATPKLHSHLVLHCDAAARNVRRHTLPAPSSSYVRLAVLVDVAGGPRISVTNALFQSVRVYAGSLSAAAAAAAAAWPLAGGLDSSTASTTVRGARVCERQLFPGSCLSWAYLLVWAGLTCFAPCLVRCCLPQIKLGSVSFLNTIAPAADIEFCDNGRTLLVPTDPATPPTAPGFLPAAALAAGYGSGGSTTAGVLAVEQDGLDQLFYMMNERVNCTLAATPYVQARRRTFYDLKVRGYCCGNVLQRREGANYAECGVLCDAALSAYVPRLCAGVCSGPVGGRGH